MLSCRVLGIQMFSKDSPGGAIPDLVVDFKMSGQNVRVKSSRL